MLHFIYATSTHTTKIPIFSYFHIYIINMNKKKDNVSFDLFIIHIHIIFIKILTSHQVTPYGVLYLGGTNYDQLQKYSQ